MLKICPFGPEIFFVVKDDIIIYSTHPNFEVDNTPPPHYVFVNYDDFLKNVENEDNKFIKGWLINYLKKKPNVRISNLKE
jgi:hypothetical protein